MRTELAEKIASRRRLPTPAVRRAIRESARVSQDEIGRQMEPPVCRATVSRWESGQREPSASYLTQYVRLLDELEEAVR